jgi:hypothetical protein
MKVHLVAALSLLSLARVASADPALDKAKELATRAQIHFDLGEYGSAAADYRDAYRLVRSPGLLYNLGQAYRLMGDCVAAVAMYRNYLQAAPESPYRAMAHHHLASLQPCAATPSPAPRDEIRTAAKVQHRGHRRKVIGYTLGASGVVLGVVGAAFAIDSTRASAPVSDMNPMDGPKHELTTVDAPGARSEKLAGAFLIGGAVTAAVGVTIYYLGWRDDRRASAFAVGPTPHGGAVATAGWVF